MSKKQKFLAHHDNLTGTKTSELFKTEVFNNKAKLANLKWYSINQEKKKNCKASKKKKKAVFQLNNSKYTSYSTLRHPSSIYDLGLLLELLGSQKKNKIKKKAKIGENIHCKKFQLLLNACKFLSEVHDQLTAPADSTFRTWCEQALKQVLCSTHYGIFFMHVIFLPISKGLSWKMFNETYFLEWIQLSLNREILIILNQFTSASFGTVHHSAKGVLGQM